MDEKPSVAIKNGRGKSSIWVAIEALKQGNADFMISAGNTGALMAMATLILKTISKIKGQPLQPSGQLLMVKLLF